MDFTLKNDPNRQRSNKYLGKEFFGVKGVQRSRGKKLDLQVAWVYNQNKKRGDHGLIALHTHPGQAASLAYFLDQKYLKGDHTLGILGSIAGDDTVLLITQGLSVVDAVLSALRVDFL